MRIDEIEFASALSSNLNAHRIISNIINSRSVARTVLVVDRLKENENPSIDLDPGGTCWQVSPYGHPMTVVYNSQQPSGNKKIRLPLHTFQMFSPPLDPAKMKNVEWAANHLLNCESLSFLSLISSMVGTQWNEEISSKSDLPGAIRRGLSDLSESRMKPCALVCDKSSFDAILGQMTGFSNEMISIDGIQTPVGMMTIGDERLRLFSYDVIGPEGGVVFICSQMMGLLSQCGDIKFWVDQTGPTGVFSFRLSMALMSRGAIFAIKRG